METEETDEVDMFYNAQLEMLPVTSEQISSLTQKDRILAQVLDFVSTGRFPNTFDNDLKHYIQRKDELTLHQGCIMCGNRVIISESVHKRLLDEIHLGHLGIVRMKAYARSYVWWPNIDSDLEQTYRMPFCTKSTYSCTSTSMGLD